MKKSYIVKNITQFNKFNDIRNQVRKGLDALSSGDLPSDRQGELLESSTTQTKLNLKIPLKIYLTTNINKT